MSSSRSSSFWKAPFLFSSTTKSIGRTSTTNTITERTTFRKSKKSKTFNPNNANYQQKLIDGDVLPYRYEYSDGQVLPLPSTWDKINERLAQSRPLLSPSRFSEDAYQHFVRADAHAFNEDAVKDSVLSVMLKAMGASQSAQKNILFINTEPITAGIAQAKPDYYYGAQPEQIHSDVRNELSTHIISSNHTHLSVVPNFFLKAKGLNGSAAVARRQACHNGAIGVRAMQSLHLYGQSELGYNNKAYTISSTYHEGQLKMYSHSVAQPNGPGTRPEYYMHQLNTWGMTGNKDAFLQGATAFKNAEDLTEKYRNAAIARANETAAQTIREKKDEGKDNEDKEETDDETKEEKETDEEEAESSNTMLSFNCGTNQNLSTLIEDGDESETSVKDDSHSRPPTKRFSSKLHCSHWRKCKADKFSSQRSSAATGSIILESCVAHQPTAQQFAASSPADCRWDGQYYISNQNPAYVWSESGWIPRPSASHQPVVHQFAASVSAESCWDGQYYVFTQNPAYVWSGNGWIWRP